MIIAIEVNLDHVTAVQRDLVDEGLDIDMVTGVAVKEIVELNYSILYVGWVSHCWTVKQIKR